MLGRALDGNANEIAKSRGSFFVQMLARPSDPLEVLGEWQQMLSVALAGVLVRVLVCPPGSRYRSRANLHTRRRDASVKDKQHLADAPARAPVLYRMGYGGTEVVE